ncbi:MAG: DUF1097 domain-containing protein [Gammaproteobacteria bacterium]
MKSLVALSLSIGVIGGIAAALCLGPLSGIVLIWVAFIAWACFFAIGGDSKALQNTIVCSIMGAVVAWIALLIILAIPLASVLSLPIWAGIVIAVTVTIMCLLAQIECFSAIPATVLGYASVAGYSLQTTDALSMGALTSANFSNPLIVVGLSLVVGAILGMISGKVGAALTSGE